MVSYQCAIITLSLRQMNSLLNSLYISFSRSISNYTVTLKPRLGVTQGHRNRQFPLTFHSNHGPISYHFRDKRWFQSKVAKYSHPRVFYSPTDDVPLGNGYRHTESKKIERWGYQMVQKRFWDRFSRSDTTPACDRQTDGQTDTARRQRPRYAEYRTGKTIKRLLLKRCKQT